MYRNYTDIAQITCGWCRRGNVGNNLEVRVNKAEDSQRNHNGEIHQLFKRTGYKGNVSIQCYVYLRFFYNSSLGGKTEEGMIYGSRWFVSGCGLW